MSANIPYYVKVTKLHTEVIQVFAPTGAEAKQQALSMPNVTEVTGVRAWNDTTDDEEAE